MLKWTDTEVTFRELPDEITLCINISGCPNRCPDCHSKYLWEDIGETLTDAALLSIVEANRGITAICFMGGDNEPSEVNRLASLIKNKNYKVGWYSGKDKIHESIDLSNFDYIKIGPYVKDYGPLDSSTTNQILYMVDGNNKLIDITYKMWKNAKHIR